MGKSKKKKSSVKSTPEALQGNEEDGVGGVESKQSVEEQISKSVIQQEKAAAIYEKPAISSDPDTLANSLSQALQGGKVSLVTNILSSSSDIIQTTVSKLPAESVLPLLAVIQSNFQNGSVGSLSEAVWLRSVLTGHAGYLMSLPHSDDILSSLLSLLEPRTTHFSASQQLAGKLEMLDKQVKEKTRTETSGAAQEKSLLSYQDDSSDELEDVIDDLLVPASDTDDDWEEEDNFDEKNNESDDSIEVVEDNNDRENDVNSMSDSD